MTEHFSKVNPGLQLFWDSTSLKTLQRCPKEYYYRILQGYTTKRAKLDLEFGIAYHSSHEAGDHVRAAGGSVPDQIYAATKVALAREEFENFTKEKNRLTLVRSVVWYYAQQRLPKIVSLNGKPLIEASFRFSLNYSAYTGEAFGLCGHLDGICEEDTGEFFVNERKTTKAYITDEYWQNFSPDTQITVYSLGAKVVYPFPVAGVIVDALSTTENFSEFGNRQILRTPDLLEEFQSDLEIQLRIAEQYARAGYWPKNEASCRLCPFKKVCSAPPLSRQTWLEADFIKRPWNPLEERS